MTVDEIFSSESEHLYFRLIAARNALNAANDPDTVQVLNDILDETLNNISRIGTDEEIAAAEEIVVRKSNKTVKDYLASRKFSLIATAIMFATAVLAVLALVIIIVGSDSKVKPIITVVLIAGGIIAGSWFVASFMKKKMTAAKESLKGKTVIGCKIDTEVKGSATRTASKSEGSKSEKTKGPKVVRNYFGVVKVVLVLGIIGALGFTVYTKWQDIVDSAQIIMNRIGLYNPGESYENKRWKEINDKLVSIKNSIYYNEAADLFDNKQYSEAIALFEKCIGYSDAEDRLVESRNYDYYTQAEKDVTSDMLRARNDLKKISLPFKNTDTLINEYGKHIDYIAVYGNGSEKFNLQNFSKKNNLLYVLEERLGWKKVENKCDREGYTYEVIEKGGEEDFIIWYITSDHVLKVTPEGETVIKK